MSGQYEYFNCIKSFFMDDGRKEFTNGVTYPAYRVYEDTVEPMWLFENDSGEEHYMGDDDIRGHLVQRT